MTAVVGTNEVERFRGIIARRFGLSFEDGKLDFLADLLQRRAGIVGYSRDTYLARLEAGALDDREFGALAPELTVPETYFFRNIEQFQVFTDVVLPDRLNARASERTLRILSAGCASGEEAYSLAILLRENAALASWDVSLRAIDINGTALAKAARGRFSLWAMRETPDGVQNRWFRRDGNEVELDETVKKAVHFEIGNLADGNSELWRPHAYDVVFCRNVSMYFAREHARALIARISRSLLPGGYLFLGHAETLRGLSHDFHLRHTHGTFYYQRKAEHELAEDEARTPPFSAALQQAPPFNAVVGNDTTWVEVIRRASERVGVLTRAATSHPPPVVASVMGPEWKPSLALDLLRQERFAEALDVVAAQSPESCATPDTLLLQAVLLAHSGRLEEAEAACSCLLVADELNAGAHYVIALCREGGGDREGARHHDQVAAYLDPTFAMPHLHLGLLARRSGDGETARGELRQALLLLESEDAARLLLFGGGFGRESLMTLCRAELLHWDGGP